MKALSILFCFTCLSFKSSVAIDTLGVNQTLKDNGETLVSVGESFELGFFSPCNSSNRYLGIWYKNIQQQTVVWVANRDNPLNDSSGILTIMANGNIVILRNQSGIVIWSSNSSTASNNPFLQLLDSGNLVLIDGSDDGNSSSYTWQSFDYPCDTLLPGMKLGWNLRTGQKWYLTSWESLQDPSTGLFTYKLDAHGLPQFVLSKGTELHYRSDPWDGVRFGGFPVPEVIKRLVFKPIFVFDENDIYYSFESKDVSVISRFVVNQSGQLEHLTWSQTSSQWAATITVQNDRCDAYSYCGPFGVCNADKAPVCRCPTGFMPKVPQDWQLMDWSGGCVPKTPLNCSATEGFRKFSKLKYPDNSYISWNGTSMSQQECEMTCLSNCSCVAYARTDVKGCVMWFGNLIDVTEYREEGHELYIRMAASELESNNTYRRAAKTVLGVVLCLPLLVSIGGYVIWKRNSRRKRAWTLNKPNQDYNSRVGEEDIELPLLDMVTIATATNNFSSTNKVGEGGFGAVYKGELSTREKIAVKRLSKDSGQGLQEFKNEIILISKLQHRNLVRLFGCCIHGEERMLIYEYMANRSLDFYIFNQIRGTSLDWKKRFHIIIGIARGLLYLHRDSRLRIIHRDLKASNILLDSDMNPKISDFGLARTFGGDQTEANTKRVIGTYGYMSPEYVIGGHFSVKSDVFSFGVLVLEIVSGKKNRGFYHPEYDLNLLGYAWKLWNEGQALELMDSLMEDTDSATEVLRCIQVGLLCVQQRPEDRPTMSSILLMVNSENSLLPQPKHPGFYTDWSLIKTLSSSSCEIPHTANEVTITTLQGR